MKSKISAGEQKPPLVLVECLVLIKKELIPLRWEGSRVNKKLAAAIHFTFSQTTLKAAVMS